MAVAVAAKTGDSDGIVTEQGDDALPDTLTLPAVKRSGRWQTRWPVLLVGAWAAMAAVDLGVLGVGSPPSATRAASHVTKKAEAPHGTASHRARAATSASAPATTALQVLVPVADSAIGQRGPGSGDNASHAYLAIDGSTATSWQSDWYRTAAFGGLQSGTGLLIDMGKQVTIARVRLTLGRMPGADVQLLTGNNPDRSQMSLQATINDAGGTVALTMASPQRARYLVIWFTLLPPESSGTFRASVSDVRIEGTV